MEGLRERDGSGEGHTLSRQPGGGVLVLSSRLYQPFIYFYVVFNQSNFDLC